MSLPVSVASWQSSWVALEPGPGGSFLQTGHPLGGEFATGPCSPGWARLSCLRARRNWEFGPRAALSRAWLSPCSLKDFLPKEYIKQKGERKIFMVSGRLGKAVLTLEFVGGRREVTALGGHPQTPAFAAPCRPSWHAGSCGGRRRTAGRAGCDGAARRG